MQMAAYCMLRTVAIFAILQSHKMKALVMPYTAENPARCIPKYNYNKAPRPSK